MVRRLTAIGQRSKNLYADLTNYVMMTVGQPTHAFNADTLALPLSVRRAADGEPFNALDGSTHTLASTHGVVADTRGPVALAGVIGGLESSIQTGTRRVLFEAATFDPLSIRRTAGTLSLRTEASTRYEKDLSTHRIDDARRLFFHLLATIDPASLARLSFPLGEQTKAETRAQAEAAGLAAAIPAAIAYNVFLHSVRELAARMDDFSLEFLNLAERHYEE